MSAHHHRPSTGSSRRRFGAGVVATSLVGICLPLVATSALAVPVAPHSIISFPARSFVTADGYAANERVTVNVLRGGFVVGTAVATADATGLVEVNHGLPGDCFSTVTPDIRAGDIIQVVSASGVVDESRTAGVTVTRGAAITAPGTVTIHGDAVSATGARIPIAELEARLVAGNQSFVKSGARTIRADWTGTADGTITYDGPGLTTWTATFLGMGAVSVIDGQSDQDRAVASESRGMWNGPSLTEVTIYESGGPTPAVRGTAAGCLVPFASGPSVDMAALSDSGFSKTDNVTNNLSPTFGGVTGLPTATSVNLYVDGTLRGNRPVDANHSYSFLATAMTPGLHTITVGEVDPTTTPTMGNAPLKVLVDLAKPTITRVAPVVNATGVRRTANVGAAFNERAVNVTRNTFTLRLTRTNSALTVAVSSNATGRVATLNPATTLLANTTYTATMTSRIQDVAGNPSTSKSWRFTTGAAL